MKFTQFNLLKDGRTVGFNLDKICDSVPVHIFVLIWISHRGVKWISLRSIDHNSVSRKFWVGHTRCDVLFSSKESSTYQPIHQNFAITLCRPWWMGSSGQKLAKVFRTKKDYYESVSLTHSIINVDWSFLNFLLVSRPSIRGVLLVAHSSHISIFRQKFMSSFSHERKTPRRETRGQRTSRAVDEQK